MASEKCGYAGCEQQIVVRVYPVRKRQVVQQAAYCDEHAQLFLAHYYTQNAPGEGPPQRLGESVGFDIELVVCEDRPNQPCQFSLREAGGSRRLDCQTGIFEAVALQRELEQLVTPRPLTHRAMASVIAALGGRLEFVEVDKLVPAQRIFEAKLHIHQATAQVVVDVRISDAVILSVICDAPIMVSNDVLTLLAAEQQH